MNASLQRAAEVIASELVSLARVVVAEKDLSDSSLSDTIRTSVEARNGGIVIDMLFDNYIEYVECGRRPGQEKRPPIDALRDWAVNKGISSDNSTLCAISEAIWRDGVEARPVLATLSGYIERQFESKWADLLFEALVDDLTNYFNT